MKKHTEIYSALFLMVVGISFNACTKSNDSGISENTINALIKNVKETNRVIEISNLQSYFHITDRFEDLSKIKYRPIKIVADTLRERMKHIVQRTEQLRKDMNSNYFLKQSNAPIIESYLNFIAKSEVEIEKIYDDFIKKNSPNLGMRIDDIENYVNYFHENFNLDMNFLKDYINTDQVDTIVFGIITQEILQAENVALGQLVLTTSGRISFDYIYFPVVDTDKACLRKGEVFKAKIGIGLYLTPKILPENTEIFVNGKALDIDEFGRASFSEMANFIGERKLTIKFKVSELDNSATYVGQNVFTYNVTE